MSALKILFVVTAFYPEQAIGSVRVTKFAKFLERAGYSVSIISLAPAPWAGRDESLWFPALDTIRWLVVPQSRVFDRIFVRARAAVVGHRPAVHVTESSEALGWAKVVRWAKAKAQLIYTLLKAFDWMIQVRKAANGEFLGEKFDVVFTSYPSLGSPFSGLMLRRMGLASLVAMDFRDPLSYGATTPFSAARGIERWLLSRADVTSYSSNGVKAKIEAHTRRVGGVQGRVLTNGFDPDDRRIVAEGDNVPFVHPLVLRFTYVGSLYGGKRDLSPLLRLLSTLVEAGELAALRLELHYAGHEGAAFSRQAGACGLESFVIDHGRVSRGESLRLQTEADICLLVTWNTASDQGILSGKVFEYFLMRKPVLAIVNGDRAESEVKTIMEEVNAGFCFEEADPASERAMRAWISSAVREKRKSGVITQDYRSAVENYSIEANVLDMFAALDTDQVSVRSR